MSKGGTAISTSADLRLPVQLWCLTDGKPGHRSQIEGLVSHLAAHGEINAAWIPIENWSRGRFLREWTSRMFLPGESMADPDLIVAAGHTTHFPALAAQHARGGKTIVLMRPSLPSGLFDLCLIPKHDLQSGFGRMNRLSVVPTQGVLNPLQQTAAPSHDRALMLIGGPSKHYGWSDDEMIHQIDQVIHLSPSTVDWTITTSRRTPPTFVEQLQQTLERTSSTATVRIIPFEETVPGWVAEQLSDVRTVFVSEDSVSMVYEALTVGADVGLLEVPRRRQSRITRGIDDLIDSRLVTPFQEWQVTRFENRSSETFCEAARCADIVCERLLKAA